MKVKIQVIGNTNRQEELFLRAMGAFLTSVLLLKDNQLLNRIMSDNAGIMEEYIYEKGKSL